MQLRLSTPQEKLTRKICQEMALFASELGIDQKLDPAPVTLNHHLRFLSESPKTYWVKDFLYRLDQYASRLENRSDYLPEPEQEETGREVEVAAHLMIRIQEATRA
jgi:hypothetical protein